MEMDRRKFLKSALVAGVATAGAGMVACSPSTEAGGNDKKDGDTAASSTVNQDATYPDGLIAEDFANTPVEVAPITEFVEEKTYDVVVVGAGTGGVPAALSAHEEGATVAVLQKESVPISQGGTCTGVLLDQSDEQGVMNYIQGFIEDCHWRADRDLAETYCKYSGEAIRWVHLRSNEAGFPPFTIRPTAVADYEDGKQDRRRYLDEHGSGCGLCTGWSFPHDARLRLGSYV